jgi:carboxymethylenebutenolidase
MGQMIRLQRPDGSELDAWQSNLDPARASVIVLQEWWGLNDQIKAIVDRFDAEGFNALAPDLYHGRVVGYDDRAEAAHMMDGLDFPGAVHQDISAALAYLKGINARVAVMGFCMGGALTIASAVRLEGFGAAVCFYGVPPKAFADPADIKIPLQGHFGSKDDWVTPSVVADMEASMTAAGNPPDFHAYDADHAFFNKARPEVHDPEAAELAWKRTIAFLRKTL